MLRIVVFLLLLPAALQAQLISVTDSTKLLPSATLVWSPFIPLVDTLQTVTLTAVTYGGTSAYINQNWRLIAQVQQYSVVDADTVTLYTATGTANFAAVCTTLTAKDLIDTWIPTLSGADSSVVWQLRRTPGWAVRFAVKGYATHHGGVKILVQKKE